MTDKSNALFPTWEALCKEGLLAITDNGGKTVDRYSAVFRDGDVLAFGGNPTHPQGISQWSADGIGASDVMAWLDPGQYQGGEALVWPRIADPSEFQGEWKIGDEPPEWMREHLLARINDAYSDAIAANLEAGTDIAEARAAMIGECFTYAGIIE